MIFCLFVVILVLLCYISELKKDNENLRKTVERQYANIDTLTKRLHLVKEELQGWHTL